MNEDEQITLHDLRIMFEQALKTNEALRERADLVDPLQERCQLLGRALTAIWGLVGEEDRQEITAVLDAPAGSGKSAPALTIVKMLGRKGGAA